MGKSRHFGFMQINIISHASFWYVVTESFFEIVTTKNLVLQFCQTFDWVDYITGGKAVFTSVCMQQTQKAYQSQYKLKEKCLLWM